VTLVPLHAKLGAFALEPIRLVLEGHNLSVGNVGVGYQVGPPVGSLDPTIHDGVGIVGGYQGEDAGSHSRIVSLDELQLANVCCVLGIEALVGVDVTPVVHSDPLELHIRYTDSASPTILIVGKLNLGKLAGLLGLLPR